MAAPLLKYDLLLVRRSFAEAFASGRDKLLLALMLAFLLLWLRDAAARAVPPLPPRAALFALAAGPASFAWTRASMRRLAWFRETSVLAPAALAPKAGLSYLASAQLPLLALLAGASLFLSQRTGQHVRPAALAFMSYTLGVAAAAASGQVKRLGSVRRRPEPSHNPHHPGSAFFVLLARQLFGARRPLLAAALLVAGSALATFAISSLPASQPPALRFAATLLPSTILLAATARNAPEIVSLLAFAGYPARTIAAFVCALPAASLAAVSGTFLLVRSTGWTEMLGPLLLLHLLAAFVATARAWLSPGRSSRAVDLQVQLEIAGMIVAATLFAPLAPVVAAWRLRRLHRHYSDLLWIHT